MYPLAEVERKREIEGGKKQKRGTPLTGAAIWDPPHGMGEDVLLRSIGAGSQGVDVALRSVSAITWHED